MTSLYFLSQHGACYASNAYGDNNGTAAGVHNFGNDSLTVVPSSSGCVFNTKFKGAASNGVKVGSDSGTELININYSPVSGFSFDVVQPSFRLSIIVWILLIILIILLFIAWYNKSK